MLKIEVWSDIACPYCYIGKYQLNKAIAELGHHEIELIYRSFELAPNAQIGLKQTIHENLCHKYKINLLQAQSMTKNASLSAQRAGLTLNFDIMIPTNTFNAHRLVHLAAQHQLSDQMMERFFKAQFVEGKDLGHPAILEALATEIGLKQNVVEAVLNTSLYEKEVRDDEFMAQKLGIRSIPFFLLDGTLSVQGSQSVDEFKRIIESACLKPQEETQHEK